MGICKSNANSQQAPESKVSPEAADGNKSTKSNANSQQGPESKVSREAADRNADESNVNSKEVPDLSIFEQTECCNPSKLDIDSCLAVKRVLVSLRCYIENTESGQLTFINLIENVYSNYLNDIIHVKTVHDSDLYKINKMMYNEYNFPFCNVKSCKLLNRFCRNNGLRDDNNMDNGDNGDSKFIFYQNQFDQIHYYFAHLFHLGLRTMSYDNNDNYDEIEEKEDDLPSNFDAIFYKKQQMILNKRKKYDSFFARFKSKNNKYILKTGKTTKCNNDEITYFDHLFQDISKNKNVSNSVLSELQKYLKNEKYETDSFLDDMEEMEQSNICNKFKNKILIQQISKYMADYQLKSMAFSTGFIFWYWPWYGKQENIDKFEKEIADDRWNRNDYDGWNVSDLFIKSPRFKTFKLEILNYRNGDNGDISMQIYKEKIYGKAVQFIHTQKVKKIRAKDTYSGAKRYYDIDPEAALTLNHLLCIICYCDFTALCTAFSSTFRRKDPHQSLEAVKQKNKYYWYLSKLLRETIEIYGDSGYDGDGGERGFFFCGMSMVFVMPGFGIRINGPTSTSTVINIAMNFTGDSNGIIITLNNKYYAGGIRQRLFSTCWISSFPDEQERVTIGGQYIFQIQAVTKMKTAQNFQPWFEKLFIFDAALQGQDMQGIDKDLFDSLTASKINKLIECELNDKNICIDIDPYISDTFHLFAIKKKIIVIDMDQIYRQSEHLQNLLFGSKLIQRYKNKTGIVKKGCSLRANILSLFPNLQKIIINTTSISGVFSSGFDVIFYIDLLIDINASFESVINAVIGYDGNSWLSLWYESNKKSLSIKTKFVKSRLQRKPCDSLIF